MSKTFPPAVRNIHTTYALQRLPMLLDELDAHLLTVDLEALRTMLEQRSATSPTAKALLEGGICKPSASR